MEAAAPAYLEKRRKDVANYRQALASEDFETVRMLGHKMKGTGTGYGFPFLTEVGGAIEKAAVERDRTAMEKGVERLAWYLEKVVLEYAG